TRRLCDQLRAASALGFARQHLGCRLRVELGREIRSRGPLPPDSFNRPSDATWDRAGNVYVADGFGSNNRIAKFTKDGKFVKDWGQTGAGTGQFNQIRAIAADAAGNIYVADAGNKRIQDFDGAGKFKSQIASVGYPAGHLRFRRVSAISLRVEF